MVQCLLHSPPLRAYLNGGGHAGGTGDGNAACPHAHCALCELERLARRPADRTASSPTDLRHHLAERSSEFTKGHQADAHECLVATLDILEGCTLPGADPSSNLVRCLTTSHLDSTITFPQPCLDHPQPCPPRVQTAPTTIHSLSIEKIVTLEDALRGYLRAVPMDGDNQAFCYECQHKQDAEQQLSLPDAAPIFMVHLKRFDAHGDKDARHVTFAASLKLDEFLPASPHAARASLPHLARLTGVVVHHGPTVQEGHYTAFVRDANHPDTWWEADDADVRQVPLTKVLAAEAYLLFYSYEGTAMAAEAVTGRGLASPTPDLLFV